VSGDLKERIEALLAGLGDDADAVADSLRSKGIKGNGSDGECCPIANVIAAEFEEAAKGIWGVDDEWFVEIGYVRTPDGLVSTPVPVKEFITVFDDGVVLNDDPDGPHTEHPYADLQYDMDEDEPGSER
jgi:hypothetical protein